MLAARARAAARETFFPPLAKGGPRAIHDIRAGNGETANGRCTERRGRDGANMSTPVVGFVATSRFPILRVDAVAYDLGRILLFTRTDSYEKRSIRYIGTTPSTFPTSPPYLFPLHPYLPLFLTKIDFWFNNSNNNYYYCCYNYIIIIIDIFIPYRGTFDYVKKNGDILFELFVHFFNLICLMPTISLS